MNKQKILLIGNGPCVLDDERGQEIDDFNGKIARINGYQIDTYENYVGTKTDILVIGQIDIKDQLEKKYDYVILYLSKLDGGENMRQLRLLYSHNKIIQFPIYKKDQLKDLLMMPENIEPTTGIIAITWFMRKNIDLYIYGFDFFTRGDEYFPTKINEKSRKCHEPKREKIYVDFLIEQNKIQWF